MTDEIDSGPVSIVKIAAIFLIGVIILSGIDNGVSSQTSDSSIISFLGQPNDGDTMTILGQIFEFDTGDGVTSGHTSVSIGNTITETVNNLETAIGGM